MIQQMYLCCRVLYLFFDPSCKLQVAWNKNLGSWIRRLACSMLLWIHTPVF